MQSLTLNALTYQTQLENENKKNETNMNEIRK